MMQHSILWFSGRKDGKDVYVLRSDVIPYNLYGRLLKASLQSADLEDPIFRPKQLKLLDPR